MAEIVEKAIPLWAESKLLPLNEKVLAKVLAKLQTRLSLIQF